MEIYFKCSCGKAIAVEETAVGGAVQCPDCRQLVVIPSPTIRWTCQNCKHEMGAPGELEGQKVQCLECRTHVTVPVIMPARKLQDSPKCPDCGTDIKPDVVLCINCGFNLKTGEKIKTAFKDNNSRRYLPIRMTVIPAIAVAVLSLLAFVWWRLGMAPTTSDKPLTEPSLAGQPVAAPVLPTMPKVPLPPVPPGGTPATGTVKPDPGPATPADILVIENDTRSLQAVIASVASNSNYPAAKNTLQSAVAKYSRAANMKEADTLLLRLQQGINLGNAIAVCSSVSQRDAVLTLEDAINKNNLAPNLAQAQAMLSTLRQELSDTDAMAMVLENAQTNVNRQSSIRMLQNALGRYPKAANLETAKQLLISYQQAVKNVHTNVSTSPSPLLPASLTSVMDNIAVIRTKKGTGTGFVLSTGGKKYIVTNRHIVTVAEAKEISFEFISGKIPTIKGFEIAKDRDLVRFEIDNVFVCAGLSLSPTPNKQIGDNVIVYGNSGGAGAITELPGKITAWGPVNMETSAEFVRGNSGSPIIDANNNVIAVATFMTRGSPKDWTVKGTRFEGVRRFGVRLDNAEWQQVNLEEFARQTKILDEAYLYIGDLFDISVYMLSQRPPDYAIAKFEYYSRPDGVARTRTRWSSELITILQYHQQIKRGGMTGEAGISLCVQKLKSAPLAPKQILKNTRWIDSWYSEEAKSITEDIDWMYTYFNK